MSLSPHEHNEIALMLVEISDELFNATEAIRKKDYHGVATAANAIKQTAHTCFATSINLDRKLTHG